MTQVGFLGPGRMGAPMVERLVAAGHEVRVLVRRPEVAERLAALGAVPVSSPAAAAEGAPVVVCCLFSDAQLAETLDGESGLLAGLAPGAVLASHVTGGRAALDALAARLQQRDAQAVDAPVSGGEAEIREGRLTVLLGGSPPAVDAVRAVVSAYADPVVPTGPLGSALAVKLVNNLLFAAQLQTAAAAVELAGDLGVSADLLLQVLPHASGGSFAGGVLARSGSGDALVATVGEFLRKDVAACRAELAAVGAPGGLLVDLVTGGPLALVSPVVPA